MKITHKVKLSDEDTHNLFNQIYILVRKEQSMEISKELITKELTNIVEEAFASGWTIGKAIGESKI